MSLSQMSLRFLLAKDLRLKILIMLQKSIGFPIWSAHIRNVNVQLVKVTYEISYPLNAKQYNKIMDWCEYKIVDPHKNKRFRTGYFRASDSWGLLKKWLLYCN